LIPSSALAVAPVLPRAQRATLSVASMANCAGLANRVHRSWSLPRGCPVDAINSSSAPKARRRA
jgi:hypothetical protein